MVTEKTLRMCEKGHEYYKSSDCPTCLTCEKENAKRRVSFPSFSASKKGARASWNSHCRRTLKV